MHACRVTTKPALVPTASGEPTDDGVGLAERDESVAMSLSGHWVAS
jgi:hypothetical protein